MPIKGLSDRLRLPRLGKIHTGIKVKNAKGVEYPQAVDYFVCPPEVQEAYSEEKPKSLRIMFPLEDDEIWANQFYRYYSASRGLMCKGDGETAIRLVDINTGELAPKEADKTGLAEVECKGKKCEYYGDKCKEMMMLQFVLPDVPGLGVYQLDTGSINSILNINSSIKMIRNAIGRIAWVPLTLTLGEQEVAPEGKKKKVHVLNIRTDIKLIDLAKNKPLLGPTQVDVPAPDEHPEMIAPECQAGNEPEAPEILIDLKAWNSFWATVGKLGLSQEEVHARLKVNDLKEWLKKGRSLDEAMVILHHAESEAKKESRRDPASVKPEEVKTINDLYKVSNQCFKMQPADVVRELGVQSQADIAQTPWECWLQIKAIKEG
jgi:hypothetical protein